MKKIVMAIVMCALLGALIFATRRAVMAPVVAKDPGNNVCWCVTWGNDTPSLDNCKHVDLNELHEVIPVANCSE